MSVIDYERKRLAPTVWGEDGNIIPQLRSFIFGLIRKNYPGAIGAYVLGSITTKRYTSDSDIDVEVVMPKSVDLKIYGKISQELTKENIRFHGSPHTIGFYAVHPNDHKDALEKTVGAYDLVQDKWIKHPEDVGADADQMEDAFKGQIKDVDISLGELNRDMRDIQRLIDAFPEVPKEQQQQILQKLQDKKEEIEEDLAAITEDYDELHRARAASFAKELESDPAAGQKHLNNQTLPGNVVFKMMERYGYRELLEKLRDIYKSLPGKQSSAS